MPDIVINGKTYEATDEALAQMQKDGVKYEIATPTPGFWESAAQTLGDTARGGAHGATFGAIDAKFGDDQQSVLERLGLASYDDVKERSPVASTVGDITGSVLSPGSKIGMAAKGAGTLAKIGRAAFGAGVESGAREAFEGGDAESSQDAAQMGAGIGAGVSGLANAAGAALKSSTAGKLAAGLGRGVGHIADTARNKAFGIGNKELQDLAKKNGATDIAANTASHLEQLLPSPKWGSNAATKGEQLGAMRDKMGAEIGAALDEAGTAEGLDAFIGPGQGNPGSWAAIQQKLAQEAAGLKQASPGELARFNAADGFAQRLANEPAPASLGGLHQRVSDWGKEAYKSKGAISSAADTAAGEAAELGRSVGRDELDAIMQYATPQTQQRFDDSMRGYSNVADYANAAEQRGVTEAAASKLMGGAVGVAAPLAGLAMGDVTGALAGAGMALHSGTRNYLTQLAEGSRGFDVAANAARAVQGQLKGAPQALPGLAEVLSAQGNRPGLLATEGMVGEGLTISESEEEARRRALGYGSRL